jgi:hypothetical protein
MERCDQLDTCRGGEVAAPFREAAEAASEHLLTGLVPFAFRDRRRSIVEGIL